MKPRGKMANGFRMAANFIDNRDLLAKRSRLATLEMQELDILRRFSSLDAENQGLAYRNVDRFLRSVRPKELVVDRLCRFGPDSDGGYVLVDRLKDLSRILSIGVGTENQIDVDFAQRGVPVFEFDHTVTAPPRRHANINFFPIGLGREGTDVRPLARLLELSVVEPVKDSILLVDIDSAEWEYFASAKKDELIDFAQIAIELHDLDGLFQKEHSELIFKALDVLFANHDPVFASVNNFRPVVSIRDLYLPQVLEVTLVKRSQFELGDPLVDIPERLVRPNDPHAPAAVLRFPQNFSD